MDLFFLTSSVFSSQEGSLARSERLGCALSPSRWGWWSAGRGCIETGAAFFHPTPLFQTDYK